MTLKNIIKNLLTENDRASLTRFIAITAWMAFLIVSGYLVVTGKEWAQYETFATFTAGGGAITQVCNKFLNKKYNLDKGDQE